MRAQRNGNGSAPENGEAKKLRVENERLLQDLKNIKQQMQVVQGREQGITTAYLGVCRDLDDALGFPPHLASPKSALPAANKSLASTTTDALLHLQRLLPSGNGREMRAIVPLGEIPSTAPRNQSDSAVVASSPNPIAGFLSCCPSSLLPAFLESMLLVTAYRLRCQAPTSTWIYRQQ
jgi:hypothetical protein